MTEKNEQKSNAQQDSILLVDDEKNILQSLKRAFYDTDITLYTASHAQEALEILKNTSVTMVISDYRMPKIDGMQFLQMVKIKYPLIYRIIFSGFIDNKLLRRSLGAGWATAYFTKPWNNDMIKKRVTHTFKLIKLMGDEVFKLLNSINYLPSPNHLLREFNTIMAHDSSKEEIIKTITINPPLVVKIFQIANALFADKTEICSVSQAVNTLKFSGLKDIALHLDFTTYADWDNDRSKELLYICFQTVLVNKYLPGIYNLLNEVNLPQLFSDIGFIINVGKILILTFFPHKYKQIKDYQSAHKGCSFFKSEIACGFHKINSFNLGSYFLALWNLPQLFVNTERFLSRPEKAPEKIRGLLKVIHYTDILVSALISEGDAEHIDNASDFFTSIPHKEINKISLAMIEEIKQFKASVRFI